MNSEYVYLHDEDIFLWPDGTECFRNELHEMNHMSDDYRILRFNTIEYNDHIGMGC